MTRTTSYSYEVRLFDGIDFLTSIFTTNTERDRRFIQSLVEALPELMRDSRDCFTCGHKLGMPGIVVVAVPRHKKPKYKCVVGALCSRCSSQPAGKIVEDVTDAAEQVWGLSEIQVSRSKP